MSTVSRRLIFVVGGPYGFSKEVYDRADELLSLSAMTFSHEMIRLIFTEQVYRAMTILRHEPYHHEWPDTLGGTVGVTVFLYNELDEFAISNFTNWSNYSN